MKKMEETHQQTISFTDFPSAAYILIKGIPLISIQRDENSNRFSFVFAASDKLEKLRMEYFNDGLIPARSFYTAIKDLKRKVYEMQGRD